MALIDISGLTFGYDGSEEDIFRNVSLSLDTNWKLGLIGRNGRGKTTLLKLLMGEGEYSGRISAPVNFEYFPYHLPNRAASAAEVIENIAPKALRWQVLREVSLLGVGEQTATRPFDSLSSGERTKILLAAMFLRENSFLLIDEPTNHLDTEGRRLLGQYLNTKSGFILVSHDRSLLDSCIDHVLSINRSDIELQAGNFSSWQKNREQRDNFERSENERLKKDIRRLETAARQSKGWADKVESTKIGRKNTVNGESVGSREYIGEKSRRMQQRRKNLERRQERAIDEKSALLKNLEKADELRVFPLTFPNKRMVELRDVSIFYGENEVCKDISFTVEPGDRIALTGKNGSGKSSILKLIAGEEISCRGSFNRHSGLIISRVLQETGDMSGSLSEYAQQCGVEISAFLCNLRKLDLPRSQFVKDLSQFSAGQKKKVHIARSLCENAHLYIWDEALNYIDVISRMQIEQLLRGKEVTMLFVEHDGAFSNNVATKICKL